MVSPKKSLCQIWGKLDHRCDCWITNKNILQYCIVCTWISEWYFGHLEINNIVVPSLRCFMIPTVNKQLIATNVNFLQMRTLISFLNRYFYNIWCQINLTTLHTISNEKWFSIVSSLQTGKTIKQCLLAEISNQCHHDWKSMLFYSMHCVLLNGEDNTTY